MKAAERHLKIQELFSKEEFLTFETLCSRLNASKASIRRDLVELEKKGLLRRVHGGALALQGREEVLDLRKLAVTCPDEKRRIGRLAAQMIEDGQTVILGGGSTVAEVARSLRERHVQIVTNSMPVVQTLQDSQYAELILTGGFHYARLGIQLGPICERMLDGVSADILILGVRGLTEAGISDTNTLVVSSIRAMMQSSERVMIVADHTKFGRNALIHIADLQEIDVVVSDSELAEEHQKMLREQGIEFHVA